ncbi:hypothetical protein ONZ45_g7346 [Pleurotus djamor]|nr:hypothetical protein ONZ45_g7346 [Pleurotus djamor]
MNLRSVLGSTVVLACVLSVYSSPVALTDDENHNDFAIEARGYDTPDFAFNLRELAAAYGSPDFRRALSHPLNHRETSLHDRILPTTPNNRPPPPGQRPPPTTGASCTIRRRGIAIAKRAFNTNCDEASLTLGGVTKPIKKVGQQGNSAITYQVTGGWPDPTNSQIVTAYAKTGKTTAETFASEIKWLGKTDQLLAEGKYEDRQFIVFHGVTGKADIKATQYWRSLAEKFMVKGDIDGCEAEFTKTLLPLILKEAKVYVDKFQVLHTDIQPGNVLWDNAGTDPTLIDWGRAEEVASWNDAIATRVTKQANFSFLKGDEKICYDLREK